MNSHVTLRNYMYMYPFVNVVITINCIIVEYNNGKKFTTLRNSRRESFKVHTLYNNN